MIGSGALFAWLATTSEVILTGLIFTLCLFSLVLLREGSGGSQLLAFRTLSFAALSGRFIARLAIMLGATIIVLPIAVPLVMSPLLDRTDTTVRFIFDPISWLAAAALYVAGVRGLAVLIVNRVGDLRSRLLEHAKSTHWRPLRIICRVGVQLVWLYEKSCLTLLPWNGAPRARNRPVHITIYAFIAVIFQLTFYGVALFLAAAFVATSLMPSEWIMSPPLTTANGGRTLAVGAAASLAISLDALSDLRRLTSRNGAMALAHIAGGAALFGLLQLAFAALNARQGEWPATVGIGEYNLRDGLLGVILGAMGAILLDMGHALVASLYRISLPGNAHTRRYVAVDGYDPLLGEEPGLFELKFKALDGHVLGTHVFLCPALKVHPERLMAAIQREVASFVHSPLTVNPKGSLAAFPTSAVEDWPVLCWVRGIEVVGATGEDFPAIRQLVGNCVRRHVPRKWHWTEWPLAGKRLATDMAGVELPAGLDIRVTPRRPLNLRLSTEDDVADGSLSLHLHKGLPASSLSHLEV